jgi:hypothetical protein
MNKNLRVSIYSLVAFLEILIFGCAATEGKFELVILSAVTLVVTYVSYDAPKFLNDLVEGPYEEGCLACATVKDFTEVHDRFDFILDEIIAEQVTD